VVVVVVVGVVVVGVVLVVPPLSDVGLDRFPLVSRSRSNWPPVAVGATAIPVSTKATPTAMALKAEKSLLTVLPPQTKAEGQKSGRNP
jgi:hypothetical protein